jgi:hypothetical protein
MNFRMCGPTSNTMTCVTCGASFCVAMVLSVNVLPFEAGLAAIGLFSDWSAWFFDIWKHPGAVEIGLGRTVDTARGGVRSFHDSPHEVLQWS